MVRAIKRFVQKVVKTVTGTTSRKKSKTSKKRKR